MAAQIYEYYWDFTVAYTDIYSDKFNRTLAIIVDFIDLNKKVPYSDDKNKALQAKVNASEPLHESSIRKIINSHVKFGFINFQLQSYHPETKSFLAETDHENKRIIFSKVMYSNASFKRSVTDSSNLKEISFIIKTLEHVKKLNKEDLAALMTVDIATIAEGYLTVEGIAHHKELNRNSGFMERKYNQINFLWNYVQKLDDLVVIQDYLYLTEEAPDITVDSKSEGRDPYLQRLYKNQLINESESITNTTCCMVEGLGFPGLIASHIKPYLDSNDDEAFDVNNGLLLSRNMDILFDRGYITFENNGSIKISTRLSPELQDYLKAFSLNHEFLNEKRKVYLDYHRNHVYS